MWSSHNNLVLMEIPENIANSNLHHSSPESLTTRPLSPTMSAKEFLATVKSGIVPVTCHDDVLRVAFIYLDEGLRADNGVFDVVEKLHAHGWSFGEG
jgi:hypothetical protein